MLLSLFLEVKHCGKVSSFPHPPAHLEEGVPRASHRDLHPLEVEVRLSGEGRGCVEGSEKGKHGEPSAVIGHGVLGDFCC